MFFQGVFSISKKKKQSTPHKPTALVTVYCDGLCEPNPGGIATCGWVAYEREELLHSHASVLCRGEGATNNVAEYGAVISALSWLLANGYADKRVIVHSDSQLLVYQLAGKYAVRAPNIVPLHLQALDLAGMFREAFFRWVPREKNTKADALSRTAYQNALGGHSREERAQKLASRVVHIQDDRYLVPSQSDPARAYKVDLARNTCDCPDFQARGRKLGYCKHILAAKRFSRTA